MSAGKSLCSLLGLLVLCYPACNYSCKADCENSTAADVDLLEHDVHSGLFTGLECTCVCAGVADAVQNVVACVAHCLHGGSGLSKYVGADIVVEAEHQVAAVAYAVVSKLEAVAAVKVGLDHANEAPLSAENGGKKVSVDCAGLGADPVECGHNCELRALVSLNDHLEGLEIDLTDSLLGAEGVQNCAAVDFLIVKCEVLDVGINACLAHCVDLSSGKLAGENAVFGVVLEVTASECGAVSVHSRTINAPVLNIGIFCAK